MPLGYGKLFTEPGCNWLYKTEPEPELHNRQVIQPRGKVLGGSSSINGLLYLRGQPRTSTIGGSSAIRAGASTTCCRTSAAPRIRSAARTRCMASAGRSRCQRLRAASAVRAFIEAAQQAGYPRNDDFNGPTQEGAGYFQLTARNGRRWSTAVGYLRPAAAAQSQDRDHALASRSCSRAAAPSASNTGGAAPPRRAAAAR